MKAGKVLTETDMKSKKSRAKKAYARGTDPQFQTQEITLGPWTSFSCINDPRHMAFVLARYKFCSKMLEGKDNVMEIGSGDGFGLPLVAQAVKNLTIVDWDERLVESIQMRLKHLRNVTFKVTDLNTSSPDVKADAAYMIDVIEHLEPRLEANFMKNITRCLKKDGVLIIGTPNKTASGYATERSRVQHINLKTMASLKELMEKYFKNVFMFGMNDEVVHTGYAPMCHYIWGLGAGLK